MSHGASRSSRLPVDDQWVLWVLLGKLKTCLFLFTIWHKPDARGWKDLPWYHCSFSPLPATCGADPWLFETSLKLSSAKWDTKVGPKGLWWSIWVECLLFGKDWKITPRQSWKCLEESQQKTEEISNIVLGEKMKEVKEFFIFFFQDWMRVAAYFSITGNNSWLLQDCVMDSEKHIHSRKEIPTARHLNLLCLSLKSLSQGECELIWYCAVEKEQKVGSVFLPILAITSNTTAKTLKYQCNINLLLHSSVSLNHLDVERWAKIHYKPGAKSAALFFKFC